MYETDPRQDANAKLLSEVRAGDPQLEKMAGGSGGGAGSGRQC